MPAPAQFVYGGSGEPCKILASSQLPLASAAALLSSFCWRQTWLSKDWFSETSWSLKQRTGGEGAPHLLATAPYFSPLPVGNWPLHSSPCPHLPFPAVCWAKIIVQSTASEAASNVGNRVTAYGRRSITQQAHCWTNVLICRTSSELAWDCNAPLEAAAWSLAETPGRPMWQGNLVVRLMVPAFPAHLLQVFGPVSGGGWGRV